MDFGAGRSKEGSLGAPPPFRFRALLIYEGLEIYYSYSIHVFTIPIREPVSILVRSGKMRAFGGLHPSFQVNALIYEVLDIENS